MTSKIVVWVATQWFGDRSSSPVVVLGTTEKKTLRAFFDQQLVDTLDLLDGRIVDEIKDCVAEENYKDAIALYFGEWEDHDSYFSLGREVIHQ